MIFSFFGYFFLFWLFFFGCVTYSQNAAEENEKVIVALAKTQRAIFYKKRRDIYTAAEKKYMDNNKMTRDSTLKFKDRKKITVTTAQIREDIEMRFKNDVDHKIANEVITDYQKATMWLPFREVDIKEVFSK